MYICYVCITYLGVLSQGLERSFDAVQEMDSAFSLAELPVVSFFYRSVVMPQSHLVAKKSTYILGSQKISLSFLPCISQG